MSAIRLTVELVPGSSWGANLRQRLQKSDWDFLRKRQYKAAGQRCEICGGDGREQGFGRSVECHEEWEYDDERHVQKLTGLIALCPRCHGVKHFGRSVNEGYGEVAFGHLMRINGWPREKAHEYLENVFSIWQERSKHPWALNLSWLKDQGLDGDLPE